jgi:hypothetical protein
MTIYATGNPVGSTNPKDLIDNAQNLDYLILGPALSYPDRNGVNRLSWAGIEASFAAAQAQRTSDFNSAQAQRAADFTAAQAQRAADYAASEQSRGYENPVPYAAGIALTRVTQLVQYNSELYKAKAGTLPWTTTGVWATDSAKLVSVGDAALRQSLAGDSGATFVALLAPMAGAVRRVLDQWMLETTSVKIWGAKGDSITDDTAKIVAADAWCAANGRVLYFPDGQYRITNGITRKARWKGSFAPTLGTFPLTADDKVFLRPGYKNKLPGSSILLDGVFTNTATTTRSDRFSSFTYGIMDDPASGTPHIEGMAIVMNMDVFDAGGSLTGVAADNRATCDVGYYATTGWTNHNNFVVFGYFPKAGTFIYGADIDYNTFDENCSTTGDIGLAICGNGTNGLSGTRYDGEIYANDHHSRSIVDNQWGTCALYIDGNVPAASAPQNSIGGHYFNGSIRTYCNNPFILDHANSVVFDGCVFEWPNMAGSTGATKALPVGSTSTYGVVFQNCRHLSPIGVDGIYQFANSIGGAFIHSDPRNGNLGVSYAGVGAFLRANGGNPSLQLTTDINGTSKGWTILENLSNANRLEARYENAQQLTLTSAGTLTANRVVAVVTGSSSAADPSIRLSGTDTSTGLYRPAANNIAVSVSGVKVADWQTDGILRPGADNTYSLGSGSFRFSQVFAATGTINTSDARLKTVRGELTAQEMEAWSNVRHVMFKYTDRIEAKGEADARLHAGYLAQEVQQAFIDAGLDPCTYALWCEDDIRVPVTKTRKATRQKQITKEVVRRVIEVVDGVAVLSEVAETEMLPEFDDLLVVDINGEPVFDGQGQQLTHQVPMMEEFEEEYESFESNGTRMGLRYSECAIFDAAYLKTLIASLEQRVGALEKA